MNFVEKGVKIFIFTTLSINFRGAAVILVPDEPVASTSSNTRKKEKKNRKLPEMAPRKLAIALHAKIP